VNEASINLLEVNGISCSIQGKTIISDISFHMKRGEIRAVIGPNGAGKSTLVRCIAGILKTGGGTIVVDGKERRSISRKEFAQCICYMPQMQGDMPPFTVRDFVAMGRYAHDSFWRRGTRGEKDRINDAMALAGVTGFADRRMPTLSGGERQMAAIAAGLAQEARLLILDEPATFLDPARQDNLLRIMQRLNRERAISILVVTHDVNMAVHFTHRILAMKKGAVVFDGESRDAADANILETVYDSPFSLLPLPENSGSLAVPEMYTA
jgi:ABC-type cobalamin/Fe3+-siderophores transport systems, ATPase components